MSHRSNSLELLSPAKTAAIGREAILHGADAVYIGGPLFGARDKAGNSVADIAELVNFAHRFRAKVYVTLNTILHDSELEAARKLAWEYWDAGVDALIVQDMGLMGLDLPPIDLHASTQCDIRTREKARFLADVGFSQIVLARELTLDEIAKMRAAVPGDVVIEHFIHGALCVAYSGQCYISQANTGRSANRGDCSQACRLPYTLQDEKGRIVAFEKHLLSLKDNNQSANLRALISAGVRSFKIEGRYKDAFYVKNITGYYRKLLDAILEERSDLARASSGRTELFFTPDPDKTFHRGATDYFSRGRQDDIGAFDTPTFAGTHLGAITKIGPDWFEIETDQAMANGDGLNYLHKRETHGIRANSVKQIGKVWRVWPNERIAELEGLRVGLDINRNSDHAWEQALTKTSAERKIGVSATLAETADGFSLMVTDEDGVSASVSIAIEKQAAQHPEEAEQKLRDQLDRFGNTDFELRAATLIPTPASGSGSGRGLAVETIRPLPHPSDETTSHSTRQQSRQVAGYPTSGRGESIAVYWSQPWFIPASAVNALRREALEKLEAERLAAYSRLRRRAAVESPVPYPEESLSYLANVYNGAARAFYAKHGVKVIAAAYEAHKESGEVSLMITRHCIRHSLSLCPKQAKGVIGVQGQVRADPMMLINGSEKLRLEFDCRKCEMHVMGRAKRHVLQCPPPSAAQVSPKRPARDGT